MHKEEFKIVKIIENNWSIFTEGANSKKIHIRKCFVDSVQANKWLDQMLLAYNSRPLNYYTMNEAFQWEADEAIGLVGWKADLSPIVLDQFKAKFNF